MPGGTGSCAMAPTPSAPRSPAGVVRCSKCLHRLQNSSFAKYLACVRQVYRSIATEEVIMAKENVFAVLSLSGGNDGLNTVIPYTNPLYRDYRPTLGIPEDKVIPLNDKLGLYPAMGPLKKYWDEGKLAIFVGIGYPHPSYSHFRSMDIWHTCEPDKVGVDGWLGQAMKEFDPNADNVLTGVNYGRGLPRALAKEGVPVA